jgi:hypothetical protein
MIDDRPIGKLGFRHWLIRLAIQTISTPAYGQELIRIAVRSHTPLPLVICRRAETLADAVERSLLLDAEGRPDHGSAAAQRLWQAYDRYASE